MERKKKYIYIYWDRKLCRFSGLIQTYKRVRNYKDREDKKCYKLSYEAELENSSERNLDFNWVIKMVR